MRRLLIVLAVLVACMAPNAAYAQDVSLVDSFTSGVGTWGSEQKEEMDSDSSEKGIENGGLLAAPAEGADGDSAVSAINAWLGGLSIPLTSSWASADWYIPVRWLLGLIIPSAIAIVFLWWGVRKGLKMLFAAFRKGKANV